MVTIVKHEWHQVDSQFAFELERDLLEEIYPDMSEEELDELWEQVEANEADLDQILEDAWENQVDIDWDHQYDDWWTSRKGGYEVTHHYGDEDSWVEPEKEPEPTHKCTKCRWKGRQWDAKSEYCRADGTIIENYYDSDTDEEYDHRIVVCPMCDSSLELTEAGVLDEEKRKEREARWAAMKDEVEDDEEDELDMRSDEERIKELGEEFEKLMNGENENESKTK